MECLEEGNDIKQWHFVRFFILFLQLMEFFMLEIFSNWLSVWFFFADEDWNFIERVYLIGHRNFFKTFFQFNKKVFSLLNENYIGKLRVTIVIRLYFRYCHLLGWVNEEIFFFKFQRIKAVSETAVIINFDFESSHNIHFSFQCFAFKKMPPIYAHTPFWKKKLSTIFVAQPVEYLKGML